MPDREQRIRERAHEIWEREGCPHGRDREHWERAAREIDTEEAGTEVGREAPGDPATRPPAKVGVGSGLQPGGTTPGGGPGAGEGSIGTGGGSTGGAATGAAKKRGSRR